MRPEPLPNITELLGCDFDSIIGIRTRDGSTYLLGDFVPSERPGSVNGYVGFTEDEKTDARDNERVFVFDAKVPELASLENPENADPTDDGSWLCVIPVKDIVAVYATGV